MCTSCKAFPAQPPLLYPTLQNLYAIKFHGEYGALQGLEVLLGAQGQNPVTHPHHHTERLPTAVVPGERTTEGENEVGKWEET